MFKREFAIIAAAVLVVLTCVPTRAQEETTNGTINGRVVNDRGEPLPGASVTARAVGSYAGRMTTSDPEGNFRFTALEPALYMISSFAPAYVSTPPDADTPAYYRIGDSARLELIRGGVITGTVTNAAGEPITGIRVRAIRIRDAKGKVSRTPQFGVAERTTDDRGIYRIYGISPGTYLVSAGGGGNQSFQFNPYETDVPTYSPASTRDNAAEYSVRSGEEITADIRYRSDPGHTVSGTV
ncbi:MAG TPA: carboxypeptidase regulatory-like domain-containing protein, partial [Pyrinomonadaceae bacterium]|nr:carboxypeptidase regulatory-like domain-containing protein [Pyrinomonadaceae bacterium]